MERGLGKFYWGFLFIMLSFRKSGFDILPDIIGFILFAQGFSTLSEQSIYFRIGEKYNIPLIILSVFSIYQQPQGGMQLNLPAPVVFIVFLVSIATFALELYVVYNLFMGIRDMFSEAEHRHLAEEAEKRWKQYSYLQIAAVLGIAVIFLPVINVVYIVCLFVCSVVLLVLIMKFLKRCETAWKSPNRI